jgi:limonene-1,2-epoxide hydrolase
VTTAQDNQQLIEAFWDDLYRQDFGSLVSHFAPQGEYTDICTPDDDVARGGDEITARLTLAFAKLTRLWDERLHLVAGDDVVMTEHIEHWEWPTGESMGLHVASVHEVSGGKITKWTDYWDMNVLTAAAPQWWFDHVLQGWK